jgi:hypothetical protein
MLNDCPEDQDFGLKQRATEALTTAFEEIPKTDRMKLLRAEFVSWLAAEAADSVLEWAETIGPGDRRGLVEAIGRSGLVDGLLDAERRTDADFDEETLSHAIARWRRSGGL